jgi:hypothetical protein
VVTAAAREYRAAMTRLAAMHHLEVSYLHVDVDALRGHVATRASSERLRLFEADVAKMRRKTGCARSPSTPSASTGEWSGGCRYEGAYRDEVLTSLIVLRAMTAETTGAVIAAPTTSLPGDLGGVRNWDFRYRWLRDSVLALEALLDAGYTDEALGLP